MRRLWRWLRDPSGEKRRIAAEAEAFRQFRWSLGPDRNPVHDWFEPDCPQELPHGHYFGRLYLDH